MVVVIAVVIAAAKVGLRWSAMLVHYALQASPAASEGKSFGGLKELPANVTPVQVESIDEGELVL
jgi:hypothetical protein